MDMAIETTIAFENDAELGWVARVIKKLPELCQQSPDFPLQRATIFRIAPLMCPPGSDLKDDLQVSQPKLISIGPYHYGKSHPVIKFFKGRLLDNYLSKIQNPSLLKEMENFEQQARDCYSEAILLDSNEFLEMLLLDGVFLVELLDSAIVEVDELKTFCISNPWFLTSLSQDLLMIENQLPFFIVQHLLHEKGVHDINKIKKCALLLFLSLLPKKYDRLIRLPNKCFEGEVHHLLHLFHTWILDIPEKERDAIGYINLPLKLLCSPLSFMINMTGNCLSKVLACYCQSSNHLHESSNNLHESSNPYDLQDFVPSATELAENGVKIKVKAAANSFLNISFSKDKGVLEIPSILIYPIVILPNLVAWERCYQDCGDKRITQYLCFMKKVIGTSKDVGLLHQKEIINRGLDSVEDTLSMFKKMSSIAVIDPSANYLAEVSREVNSYCQLTWPKWREELVRDYFSSPWAAISLLAAAIFLGLTILQTVYSILSYYSSSHPSGRGS